MRILLTGASGQLGAYLIDQLRTSEHELIAWSKSEPGHRYGIDLIPVDLTNIEATALTLDRANPEVILHVAALSTVDAVRLDPAKARATNIEATSRLADWCDRHDRKLVFTSTDLVFDGSRPWNHEDAPAEPILAYGRTKRDAEAPVLSVPRGVVARISLLYGPSRSGRPYFFDKAVSGLRSGEPQTFFEDEYRTPLHLATAASILIRLAESDCAGLFHVAGAERVSRFELMQRAASALGFDPGLVLSNRRADVTLAEPRPRDVSLDTSKLASAFPDLRRPTIEESLRPEHG